MIFAAACGGSEPDDLAGAWQLHVTSVSGDCYAAGFSTDYTFIVSAIGESWSVKPPEADQTSHGSLLCNSSLCGGVIGFNDPDGFSALFETRVEGGDVTGTGQLQNTPENPGCSQTVNVTGEIN